MARLLDSPKIEIFPQRSFAGLVRRYTMQIRTQIPAQWVAYNAMRSREAGAYYGVAFNFDPAMESFDYLCGQEGTSAEGFGLVTIEGAYARFATSGHISTMQAVWEEVYTSWLQGGALRGRSGPSVEFYPPEFDGMAGTGGFEVWVPVQV